MENGTKLKKGDVITGEWWGGAVTYSVTNIKWCNVMSRLEVWHEWSVNGRNKIEVIMGLSYFVEEIKKDVENIKINGKQLTD